MEQYVTDLEGKMDKMVEDVGSFIDTYSGVVGSNKTKISISYLLLVVLHQLLNLCLILSNNS